MAISRDELNQIFRENAAMEFSAVPQDEESIDYTFSESFIRKMDKLIKSQKKMSWNCFNTAKKRVAVIAIVILSVFITACSFEEVRESLLRWCAETYEEFRHYFFEGETTKEIMHEYQLTAVPEGFEVVQEIENAEWKETIYENELGDRIDFSQHATKGFNDFWDNEKAKWSTVIIEEKTIELFEDSNVMGAVWVEDGYYMSFIYHGCKDVQIIKEMIETIE